MDAEQLHRDAVVIDGIDLSVPTRERFLRMRDAGVTAVHVTVALVEDLKETIRAIVAWNRRIEANADLLVRVERVGDIERAHASGRVGVIYGFQNTSPLEDEPAFVDVFARLGVRVVQLAYMFQNLVGCGCLEPHDGGLTRFGRLVVAELNRAGIVVDLSHCGRQTTADAIAVAETPVWFSHAACRELVDNPRNKTDDELRAVAARGGVIGLVAFPSFIAPEQPTIADWFRHLEHLLEVVGPDAVSVGTDFIEGQPEGFADRAYFNQPHPPGLVPAGWPWPYPEGIASVDDLPNVTRGMVERGFDEVTIRKILGGNLQRLFAETWV